MAAEQKIAGDGFLMRTQEKDRPEKPYGERPGAQRQRGMSRQEQEQMRRRHYLRQKRRRRQVMAAWLILGGGLLVLLLLVGLGVWAFQALRSNRTAEEGAEAVMQQEQEESLPENLSEKPPILEDFLTPNEYSRPGEPLTEVTELFVHYTANAGTSAEQNRNYFENLGVTGETSASSHFIIGYEGEIIQCLPLDEIGYAVKQHNYNSISIECCYLDEDGEFTQETYESLVSLLAWLMKEYHLGTDAILRHYDCGGKLCPLYYVDHEDAWEKLKEDVAEYIAAASAL